MSVTKSFPEGMTPLDREPFHFSCHSKVACFTNCCRNVNMFLYPYDILRLKQGLNLDSESVMRRYTRLSQGDHPYFPAVMLKLADDDRKSCPFLSEDGCTIYENRPSACRTYPLERAVDRTAASGYLRDYYFLTTHSYCQGHAEDRKVTVNQWIREQQLEPFNRMNDEWALVDTLFATNPWKGEGAGGPRQQMAFMVCYNIDQFRLFVATNKLVDQFKLSKEHRKRIAVDDTALLSFGFEWLKLIHTGKSAVLCR